MLPVAFFLTVILFVVLRLTPGDPAQIELGEQATPYTVAALHHDLGLDAPLPVQYAVWLNHVLRGDLGRSLSNRLPVRTAIADRLPATLELGGVAFLLHVALALSIGTFAAIYRRSLIGPATTLFASVFVSLPAFFLAILLVLVFSIKLRVLPVSGFAPLYGADADPIENLRHLILPVVALAMPETAALARLVRASVVTTLYSDYVRTARAKGLAESSVILRHAMRNAALPIITSLGLTLGFLFSGTFIIEYIFAWPGVGRLAVNALSSRDYPIVQGVVLCSALAIMAVNLLTDIAYAAADPRISYTRLGT
jgi:ABC-type dipeptide/oligopeptide/nickel transport system permease component